MPARSPDGHIRKLIAFDGETWHAIQSLARDSMKELQELADEAFADLLRKHGRPVTVAEALRRSAGEAGRAPRENRKPRRSLR